MKKAIFIQARLSSNRFPGKMLYPIGGMPLVEYVYRQCAITKEADLVAVITSIDKSDDALFDYCVQQDIETYRGSFGNVLDRYISATEFYQTEIIGRVCGDSPFVDIQLLDSLFQTVETAGLDYAAPDKKTCISGLDSEVMTKAALKKSWVSSNSTEEQEHVTLFIKNNLADFKTKFINAGLKPDDLHGISLAVDYLQDITFCRQILSLLPASRRPTSSDIISLLINDTDLRKSVVRNTKVSR